jgi:ketosteroid isomerase-like protein
MSEDNKRVVRRYFEELDRLKASPVELCAPGFTFEAAGFPAVDLEDAKQFTAVFYNAFPDLAHPVDELVAEGDKVAFRCRYEGTHTGADFMGTPSSGRHFSATGAGIVRVADGKVAEFWVSPDRMSIMEQIGALPAQEPGDSA